MSDKSDDHGATTVHASKGGGGMKWLLGAAAAVILVGGGYLAWKNYGQNPDQTQTAYNDGYSNTYADDTPSRAGPLAQSESTAEGVGADDSVAEPAAAPTRRASTSTRRSTERAAVVPEETIGITPASYSGSTDSEELVVTAPHRPIWSRTPTARRLSAMYPERALARGREGEARLHCIVENGGALDCERVSETPGGFGSAALRVARTFRHSETMPDGSNAIGTPVNLRVVFRMDENTRRG